MTMYRRRTYVPPPAVPDFFGRWRRRGNQVVLWRPGSSVEGTVVDLAVLRGEHRDAEIARVQSKSWVTAADIDALRRISGMSA